MSRAVAAYALVALASLVAVSFWAATTIGIGEAIAALLAAPAAGTHPWFVATLADAYFAFGWFWLWVIWRERRAVARVGWGLAILALGNIAMAAYVLGALARAPRGAGVEALFQRRP